MTVHRTNQYIYTVAGTIAKKIFFSFLQQLTQITTKDPQPPTKHEGLVEVIVPV